MDILAGYSEGAIIGCYVTGKIVNSRARVGGMAGLLNGFFGNPVGLAAIIASYSAAEVELTGATARGAYWSVRLTAAPFRTATAPVATTAPAVRGS